MVDDGVKLEEICVVKSYSFSIVWAFVTLKEHNMSLANYLPSLASRFHSHIFHQFCAIESTIIIKNIDDTSMIIILSIV